MTEEVLNDEDRVRAKMIEGALVGSGIMSTIQAQIDNGVREGKVTIADASKHREILVLQAATTMAKGIEGAFAVLERSGYIIVKQEGKENGEDTSVATQGGTEPERRTEREGQGVSQGSGLKPESSSEGSSIGSGGDEAQRIIPSSNG